MLVVPKYSKVGFMTNNTNLGFISKKMEIMLRKNGFSKMVTIIISNQVAIWQSMNGFWIRSHGFISNLMAKWLRKNGYTMLKVKPGTTSNLAATWRKMRQ